MRIYSLALFSVLAVPSAARAEPFRYRYRPGQVIETRVNLAGAAMMGPATASMMKSQFRVAVRQTARVRSVAGGVVTLEIVERPISGKITAMGRTESYQQKPTSSIVRITERGKFLSRKTRDARPEDEDPTDRAIAEGADALFSLNFPNRELKPGDTWHDTLTVGDPAAPRRVQMSCRYVARETFNGRPCAKIAATISMPLNEASAPGGAATEGRLTGTMTSFFDPKAGMELYSSGSLVYHTRTDVSSILPDGGDFVAVSKINFVQLTPARR